METQAVTAFLVADVGNSRIKWGRCDERRVLEAAALPLDDAVAWHAQRQAWRLPSAVRCVVAGSNPPALGRLASWLAALSHSVESLDSFGKLPIEVNVDQPERVGLDRLLKAVAANSRDRGERPAIVVDAGSAVTVVVRVTPSLPRARKRTPRSVAATCTSGGSSAAMPRNVSIGRKSAARASATSNSTGSRP